MLFLLPALLLSVSAGGADPGDGIRVATEGTLRLSAGADVRVAGNLEADGKLLVRGRLEVGGDLRLSSARFEEGSELTLTGGRAHRLDVPDDLALWN
ncbi:MAG: hypothetical protein HYY17_04645, partial [Planctomycetes bacterium]|nr:hypothetical protein [Planctomycetota bacterium]